MILTIPNLLSLIRLLVVPLFISLLIYQDNGMALLVFLGASLTDAADGYIARRFNQRSYLGSILDPLADKAILVGAFVTLSFKGMIPPWLTVVVASRDVIIVGGVVIKAVFFDGRPEIKPSMLGKLTTFFQFTTVLVVMMVQWLKLNIAGILLGLYGVTFTLTILSGAHYIYQGITQMD
jgi:cardiolipin synthase